MCMHLTTELNKFKNLNLSQKIESMDNAKSVGENK